MRADFVASVLAGPIVILLLGLLAGGTAGRKLAAVPVAVVRVDARGAAIARAQGALPAVSGFRWVDPDEADGETTRLTEAVRAGTFDAALVLRPSERRVRRRPT